MLKKPMLATVILSLGSTIGAQAAQPEKQATPPAATKSAAAIASAKAELPYPNGENWATATEREKLSYILGILNMAMAEYQLTGATPKYRTLVPKMVQSLDGKTLRQIMEAVDAYYKANPAQQKRSIFEVIWFEIVAPTTVSDSHSDKPAASK